MGLAAPPPIIPGRGATNPARGVRGQLPVAKRPTMRSSMPPQQRQATAGAHGPLYPLSLFTVFAGVVIAEPKASRISGLANRRCARAERLL
jgi:hypothetical protein